MANVIPNAKDAITLNSQINNAYTDIMERLFRTINQGYRSFITNSMSPKDMTYYKRYLADLGYKVTINGSRIIIEW